jgi:hypothetical protein
VTTLRITCVGGKLDGTTHDVTQEILDRGHVVLARRGPLFAPDAQVTWNDVCVAGIVHTAHYKVTKVYSPRHRETPIYVAHEPNVDVLDAILQALRYYGTKESENDAQQP